MECLPGQRSVMRTVVAQREWTRRSSTRRAFTLVEMIIVVLILGILGSVAAPKLIGTTQVASVNAFTTQLTAFADAFDLYKAENGAYPSNAFTGVLPTGMDKFINAADYARETPLGGRWDYTAVGAGTNAGVGVEYLNGVGFPGTATLLEVDTMLDNGNLATGALILINSTHKWLYWRYGN